MVTVNTDRRSPEIRVPRLRPYLGRLWRNWLDQRRLSRVVGLVPSILATVPPLPDTPHPALWVVQSARWSQTGVAVVRLGPRDQAPAAVMKAALSTAGGQGLRDQTRVQAALWADSRLGDWRSLLPPVISADKVAGVHYLLQRALPGVPAWTLAGKRPELVWQFHALAAAAIQPLHDATAETMLPDEAWLARAVDNPLALISQAVPSQLHVRRAEALGRLRQELCTALAGRALRVGWIHGDLWLGNLLLAADGARVTGIVDWSEAAPRELASHDLLHLLLHRRQQAQRSTLGGVVCDLLSTANWSSEEQALIAAWDRNLQSNSLGHRALILLYWLRRLTSVSAQGGGQERNPVWVAWNIDQVLQCL